VHGDDEATAAANAGAVLFGQGDLTEIPESTLTAALSETPHGLVEAHEISGDLLPSVDELFVRSGLVESKSAARRAINEGGGYCNNVKLTDPGHQPSRADLIHGRWLVLRRGKRNIGGIEVTVDQR
jgi:tyrosyl-tRNA synthetase